MKLTPWFPGSRKPARPGAYIRDIPGGPAFAMWTSDHWRASAPTPHRASLAPLVSGLQHKRWRGLAEQPKGAAKKGAAA